MAKQRRISFRPEYSAQRRTHAPNPTLKPALSVAAEIQCNRNRWERVADLGCGKLRHYDMLITVAKELFLVDTPEQLSSTHCDQGEYYSVLEVAERARARGQMVYPVPFEEFASSKLRLDLIVCIAVLDVITPHERRRVIRSAAQNLAPRGLLVIIVPRNDSTILKRCGRANAYSDGHVFSHHGIRTFFHNFRNHQPVIRSCMNAGLRLIRDLSSYRQVCLVFGRAPKTKT